MKTKITFLCLLVGSLLALSPSLLAGDSTRLDGVPNVPDGDKVQDITPGPVPDELIVNSQGLDWVWASPCVGEPCSNPQPTNQVGWRYATDEELLNRPACTDFQRPDTTTLCASEYFDPNYNICNYEDCLLGGVASEPGQICFEDVYNPSCEAWYVRGELDAGAATARFHVTKTFSDESEDEVKVTLTCNTGLPLEQSLTIAGGDPAGVTFVVTEITDGATNCEVTESGSPNGYTPIFNDGDGCAWTDLSTGVYECAISNEAQDGTFTVNKIWNVFNDGGVEVVEQAWVTIYCDAEITNNGDRAVSQIQNGSDTWYLSGYLGDGESLTATVSTTTGPATCWASESIDQSGVESSGDCGSRPIPAGGSSSCTFTNTVFFEGVPTMNQYGLALMALLMLGVGFVGFRRFS